MELMEQARYINVFYGTLLELYGTSWNTNQNPTARYMRLSASSLGNAIECFRHR